MGRRMMRRRMMRRMMMRDHACGLHREEDGTWESQIPPEQELAFLEEYQRDLEEALADVADRVKTLKEATADSKDEATPVS